MEWGRGGMMQGVACDEAREGLKWAKRLCFRRFVGVGRVLGWVDEWRA